MLVDSSVWIPFLRGDVTPEVELLSGALEQANPVWLAPPILQEVLQGADSAERFARWDRVLGELPMVPEGNARETARGAALLYARCRWQGVTPRSANDCLIAEQPSQLACHCYIAIEILCPSRESTRD